MKRRENVKFIPNSISCSLFKKKESLTIWVDVYSLVSVTVLFLLHHWPVLSEWYHFKIRGGSSCHYVFEAPFQRQRLARAAYLCSVQNKVVRWFFVMLTHTVKKFVFPPQNGFDLALFFWPAAGLQQQVEGQLLLLSSTSLDSFSKIWSPQLRRKERKMCFGDKQRNFHSPQSPFYKRS